jgi:hypothetical protein
VVQPPEHLNPYEDLEELGRKTDPSARAPQLSPSRKRRSPGNDLKASKELRVPVAFRQDGSFCDSSSSIPFSSRSHALVSQIKICDARPPRRVGLARGRSSGWLTVSASRTLAERREVTFTLPFGGLPPSSFLRALIGILFRHRASAKLSAVVDSRSPSANSGYPGRHYVR